MSCVIFKEHVTTAGEKIIEIVLNAERSLNALSLDMIKLIQPALDQYRDDDSVIALMLDSVGEKAFCAGGDVVNLYHALKEPEGVEFAADYFGAEYRLDFSLHTYPKPIIVWGAGIVMGGGVGLFSGCSHRVVTQSTMIAMPEVTIGLYPDVGASWFLNKCPGRVGLFLGITGQRINGADAKYIGIADRQLDNQQKSAMIEQLLEATYSDSFDTTAVIDTVLKGLEKTSEAQRQISAVREHYDQIQALTDVNNVIDLMANLKAFKSDVVWLQKAQKAAAHGSPMSTAIIFRQLKNSQHLSLKQAFLSEMALSVQCCIKGDLAEGVRALLVDKDGKPNWRFKSVEEVDALFLDEMFSLPWHKNPIADL